MMSSWRSSNVDEMVWAAFVEEGLPPPPKEGEHRRVSSGVVLAMVRCGLPPAGGAPRSGAVVGVVADDDGVVPGCLGGGTPQSPVVMLDVADDGVLEDPAAR